MCGEIGLNRIRIDDKLTWFPAGDMRRLDSRIAGDIVENAVTLVDFCPGFLTFELKWQLLSLPGVHRCAVLHGISGSSPASNVPRYASRLI